MSRFRVITTTGHAILDGESAGAGMTVAVTDSAYCHHVVKTWRSSKRRARGSLAEAERFADAMNRHDGDYRSACNEVWPSKRIRLKRLLPVGLNKHVGRDSGFLHRCGRRVYASGPVGGPLVFPETCWYCGSEVEMEER